jgi:hypothetical protein
LAVKSPESTATSSEAARAAGPCGPSNSRVSLRRDAGRAGGPASRVPPRRPA